MNIESIQIERCYDDTSVWGACSGAMIISLKRFHSVRKGSLKALRLPLASAGDALDNANCSSRASCCRCL